MHHLVNRGTNGAKLVGISWAWCRDDSGIERGLGTMIRAMHI